VRPCRECQHEVSEQDRICPQCGARFPADESWEGWGYEYRSKAAVCGLPWLHVSFKYRPNWVPVPAKGVLAIGQFACGLITVSQFGVGLVSLSQVTLAGWAIAQVAVAYSLIAQVGIGVGYGYGPAVRTVTELSRPRAVTGEAVEYTPLSRDDWQVSTPAEQGLDAKLVDELYRNAARLDTLYALLVVKNGHVVAEGYFHEGSVDQLFKRASVTKSYTSALVGIALEEGHLSSVDQKMLGFFPEIADRILDPRKKQITIRQLLRMRGGYPWEETDGRLWAGVWSGRHLNLVEDFPPTADPGTRFQYGNVTSNWLGITVARACGTDLKSFADEHLFSPLGVRVGPWNQDLDG